MYPSELHCHSCSNTENVNVIISYTASWHCSLSCTSRFMALNTIIQDHKRSQIVSLLGLQPCVYLGLFHLWRSRNRKCFRCGVLSPTPNPKDQRLHFVWPLPFNLSGMDGFANLSSSRQHSSPSDCGAQTSCAVKP
jgi:hypothetical protein